MKTKKINKSEIPEEQLERIARCLLPDITEFFSSPGWEKEVEPWIKLNIT